MRRLLSSLVLVLAAGIVVAGVTSADWPQTVDGMAVYLGVLPAVMVEGHPPGHPEARVAELGRAWPCRHSTPPRVDGHRRHRDLRWLFQARRRGSVPHHARHPPPGRAAGDPCRVRVPPPLGGALRGREKAASQASQERARSRIWVCACQMRGSGSGPVPDPRRERIRRTQLLSQTRKEGVMDTHAQHHEPAQRARRGRGCFSASPPLPRFCCSASTAPMCWGCCPGCYSPPVR